MQDTGWIHYNIGYRLDTKQYRIKVGNITQIKGWIHYNEEYRLEFRGTMIFPGGGGVQRSAPPANFLKKFFKKAMLGLILRWYMVSF